MTNKLIIITLFIHTQISVASDNFIWKERKHLDISNGLSHNGITDILYDSRGYIWITTYDGLNCYCGNSNRIYKNSVDSKTFPSNRLRSITEDNRGKIWIGSEKGLFYYNYSKDEFITAHTSDKNLIITDIITTKDKVIAFSLLLNRIF